ncbi:hypothetical protein A0H81_02120 [Grifola frondosa]|uniref:Uncharacterized protein n=1 Tax=Grifola frondosa TaxID=5627 RepID=A0A1C7MNR1_GRIFR|nr:hypothetical protein A0H81_02120 [Grifola frondosa]
MQTIQMNFQTSQIPHRNPPASQLVSNGQPLRPGVMVVPDPYETYLRASNLEKHRVLWVAKESHALRSINGLVDNKEDVEGIIDPGSQIISMSEEDSYTTPPYALTMQSANGEVDQSLGLVRNVPFQVSDIVLYLQIHVIRQAAYDILLGRPFDVLTESVIQDTTDNRTHFPPRQDSTSAFVTQKKKYKPVALKVRPVLATLPNRFRIVRNIQGDPLADMPPLDPNPPTFEPTGDIPSTS